jgi:SAM-dependent methyltransferase
MGPTLYVLTVGALMWLLLTEGTYLHPRITRWLYRRGAATYHRKWRRRTYRREIVEREFLAPIRELSAARGSLRVLDACCGSGRVAQILTAASWFHGEIHAFDASPEMLAEFARWQSHAARPDVRIVITESSIEAIKFPPGDAYDVVTMLEASELLPNAPGAIACIAAPLRSGGLLLVTKPPDWIAWMFPGRSQGSASVRQLLTNLDFEAVRIRPWRWRYEIVTAWKRQTAVENIIAPPECPVLFSESSGGEPTA